MIHPVPLQLVMSAIVFKRMKVDLIADIKEEPIDAAAMEAMPGIVGYIVRPGDELWTLAKNFNTTVEQIMETNHLEQETLKERQKLVIMQRSCS